ncbi:unnamed protein product [Fusarium graminearum]|uniref:Chromosome 3, complete genome n=1 Tax=Gibberella zeae (strain ATCC MYA-4620 / CBS 123657 / FGSC 9075 / NRRL 31084 / PH-1) TaxID=229533 RepID=I1S7E1_GIBZE|nr:hypothetical protein FGSG_12764 [Fusarium graminearum PH-1]ESU11575.1 hypothetical protein FGSG_12764 [Fusarium graminearum PH-1]CEF86990.1 unnamed protein product [Fusarium graminearum]CZS84246.1 unnamed protein product [Fusarium graminearum]|eukprot:XP_011324151.1 hypothetical protein FGSG_12764 [Fusarium graminearum PH-1]
MCNPVRPAMNCKTGSSELVNYANGVCAHNLTHNCFEKAAPNDTLCIMCRNQCPA